MKGKFISVILSVAVILGLMLVPAATQTLASPSGPYFVIDPDMTKVGFGEDFSVNVAVIDDDLDEMAGFSMYLLFDTDYVTLTDISYPALLPNGQPPDLAPGVNPDWNNTEGWGFLQYGPAAGFPNIFEGFVFATLNFTSKSLTGTSYLNIDPGAKPMETFILAPGAVPILDWGSVVNGTVKCGAPVLTVDVSPAGKGDVEINGVAPSSYPDISTWAWDEVVDLEAVDSVAGWTFDSWSGDLSGITNPTSIIMDDDKGVTANFVELPPVIGLSPDSLSFVTYEGVNPPDQTFDITNEGGGTLAWAIEPRPTWTVGDWWLYYNEWGTEINNVSMTVTGTSDCNYECYADFDPDGVRTIEGGMPAIAYDATVLVDQRSLDMVQQAANMDVFDGTEWISVIADVSWVYFGDHGWPYYGGKSWAYDLTMVVTIVGAPPYVPPLVDKTITAYAIVSGFAPVTTAGGLTFDCWEISHMLDPGDPANTTFMQTYWSDEAQNFVMQWDAGTFDAPPLDIRSLLGYSSSPPAGPEAWLSATPTTGTLVGHGASETVTVSCDVTGLTVAVYNGVITVTDPCVGSATVDVALTVKPATYIPSERNLPGEALEYDQTYPGATFDVYVNFTASADGLNSIGLTDVAPDGWIVEVDKTWCTPAAYAVQKWGNEVEILWSGPFDVGQDISAMYRVTVPDTAKPGINTWEVCPDMDEAWLEYYFGEDGPHAACISGEYELIVTVPGDIVGETRDVNAAPLGDVVVTLLKEGEGALTSGPSTPDYSNTAYTTGMYWQVATKALYYTIDMTDMVVLAPYWIDLSTPELLSAGYVFDFEANYGLVPMACDMWYAQKSVNLWLFPPAEEFDIYGTVINSWGIDEWKALDSIHSWQFPS